jgi:DNA-binding response OmpR family regulator
MKMRMIVLAVLMTVAPQTRATINRALRHDDFEVVWAVDTTTALEASTRRRPDLVLVDLNQPLESAWENLENLKAANPNAPVVLLAEPGATHNKDLANMQVTVVEKPFGAAALADAVNALLNVPHGSGTLLFGQDADVPGVSTEPERLRENLLARRDAPLAMPPSYRHWGINE